MRYTWLRTVLVTMTLLSGISSILPAQRTTAIGGSGGTEFDAKCPEGEVLVGLIWYSGSWLDQLKGTCGRPNLSTGSWSEGGRTPTAGTQPLGIGTWTTCAGGYAIKGFKGYAGWYVNSLNLNCEKLGAGARTAGSSTALRIIGASGGTSRGPYSCPEAKPAIGFWGRAEKWIDRFGLICGYIMPDVPALLLPAHKAEVISKRPTFTWSPTARITKPYNICMNLTSTAACAISGTLTAQTTKTDWTPTADLPFNRGDLVYWRVEACNDNGCKNSATPRSFRFLPPQ